MKTGLLRITITTTNSSPWYREYVTLNDEHVVDGNITATGQRYICDILSLEVWQAIFDFIEIKEEERIRLVRKTREYLEIVEGGFNEERIYVGYVESPTDRCWLIKDVVLDAVPPIIGVTCWSRQSSPSLWSTEIVRRKLRQQIKGLTEIMGISIEDRRIPGKQDRYFFYNTSSTPVTLGLDDFHLRLCLKANHHCSFLFDEIIIRRKSDNKLYKIGFPEERAEMIKTISNQLELHEEACWVEIDEDPSTLEVIRTLRKTLLEIL